MLGNPSIARNTLVNACAAVLMTILNLVLTALLARGLERDQFGMWSFLMILTFNQGYFALIDGGMSVSALRQIVHYEHSGELEDTAEVLATIRAHFLLVSAISSILIFSFGGILLSAVWNSISSTSIVIVVVTLVIRLFADTFHASNMMILESRSLFAIMRILEIFSFTFWTVSVAVILQAGQDLATLAIGAAVSSILLVVASTLVVSRQDATFKRVHFKWRRSIAKYLWKTGKWVAVQRVFSVIYSQMDRTIIAVVLGVTLIGDYEIPYKFQAMGVLILSVFPSALFPTIANLAGQEDRLKLEHLFFKATRWTVGLSLPILLTGIFMSGPLIRIWVGDTFTNLDSSVSLFLLWPVIASFNVIGAQFLSAMGKTKASFFITSSSVLVNLVVSLAMVRKFGINGVMIGTIVGIAIVFLPYLAIEKQLLGFGYRTWFKEIVAPVIPALLVEIPLLILLRFLWVHGSNSLLIVAGSCLVTLIGLLIFVVLSPEFKRQPSFKALLNLGA